MSRFSVDEQWRSFQTFVAAYVVGMLHPLVSRRQEVSPPLAEFRYDCQGILRFSMGELAWSQ